MAAPSSSRALSASIKGTPAFWVYGATKAAIRNFVRAWTVELKDRRIRSNVLSPGPTETPIFYGGQTLRTPSRESYPRSRWAAWARPTRLRMAALFLASDDSSFITGTEFVVDGGRAQV